MNNTGLIVLFITGYQLFLSYLMLEHILCFNNNYFLRVNIDMIYPDISPTIYSIVRKGEVFIAFAGRFARSRM